MPSPTLSLNSTSPSAFSAHPSKPKNNKLTSSSSSSSSLFSKLNDRRCSSTIRCGGSRGGSSVGTSGYDLYELLGVESSSDQAQIKKAYRALQKRCHPDIAGAPGHDMAIVLNEIYSLLSDPIARSAYDQEQAKVSEFQGYNGKPLYSTWNGSESEERAVFVDEVKCVGCLKCALFANKTFAIESVYGRARVVSQWADPESKILDAIDMCPVDCISIVERSDLAALEFLMSKQPRGSVRMTAGNTAGERVSNIFAEVSKFQNRFHEMRNKASREESKESDLRRNSIFSAIQGIRSITNWWYWQAPNSAQPGVAVHTRSYLALTDTKTTEPDTERLREVAAKLRSNQTETGADQSSGSYGADDEYWTPTSVLSSSSNWSDTMPPSTLKPPPETVEDVMTERTTDIDRRRSPASLVAPTAMAVLSAAMTGTRGAEVLSGGGVREGGAIPLEVVNSFELQIVLAGATWFMIGMAIVGLVESLGGRGVYKR